MTKRDIHIAKRTLLFYGLQTQQINQAESDGKLEELYQRVLLENCPITEQSSSTEEPI